MVASDAVLVAAIERAFTHRRYAWEGKPDEVLDLGDALVRAQGRAGGTVARLALDPSRVEARLDELIEEIEGAGRRCLWIVSPSTCPADLGERLAARGFQQPFVWDGLALTDLGIAIDANPDVAVEPLSWKNAQDYATRCTPSTDPRHHAYLLECAHRYLQLPERTVEVLVARLDGEVAGYAVLWVEPDGVAHLCDALTAPAFRRRGVYLSLVARRLALARAAGCVAAVTSARIDTSAPILAKRGFRPLCRVTGYLRPRAASANPAG